MDEYSLRYLKSLEAGLPVLREQVRRVVCEGIHPGSQQAAQSWDNAREKRMKMLEPAIAVYEARLAKYREERRARP